MDEPRTERQPEAVINDPAAIDKLINAFSQQWKASECGAPVPRLEDYLQRVAADKLAAVFSDLLQIDISFRESRQLVIDPADMQKRFPQFSHLIQPVLNDPSCLTTSLNAHLNSTQDGQKQLSESDIVISGADDDIHRPTRLPKTVESDALLDQANDVEDHSAENANGGSTTEELMPSSIGRFVIQKVLGEGAFGRVYLAMDSELRRPVALKVLKAGAFASMKNVESFINEARNAARLRHPGLVTVYDVQKYQGRPFVVQEYIAGQTLANLLRSNRLSLPEMVRMVIDIADAIGAAHAQGLVHRDLKPANILLNQQGRPHVADFGLALHESVQRKRKGEVSGTPAYMSPEQLRGESHRLDGRTDIWSLGVIFYEMLAGKRPFDGQNQAELLDEIQNREPRPPRQLTRNSDIDDELERICLKCLEKRSSNRYGSATQLIDDLQYWLQSGHSRTTEPVSRTYALPSTSPGTKPATVDSPVEGTSPVVPKGLRSFDQDDADFFLLLLPGPRDRHGLPETIRYWKSKIEQTDAEQTFGVGLIYGPSGCGKSSFVKAGLLPLLDSHVTSIHLEAAPDQTDVRLKKALVKRFPQLEQYGTSAEMMRAIREGEVGYGKVLLVIDQFEQWLYSTKSFESTVIGDALRQCDGAVLQCLLLVRDDFWMAISRFMHELEIEIEGSNSRAVDLFDPDHAKKILILLGQAYGRLPNPEDKELSADQHDFIDSAIDGICENGKVVCVRLSLFADMVKNRSWSVSELKKLGGTEGVGEKFLEETFNSASAPPHHRFHQQAAREVLAALLPEVATGIKGAMRSKSELLQLSGYEKRPEEFERLIRILDRDLRLITPAEVGDRDESSSPEYYQLTHDFLVPSLRTWLTRKKKETRRGQAEIRLEDRASLWSNRPERRLLPGSLDYLRMRFLTERKKWTPSQRQFMQAAGRHHTVRSMLALLMALFLGWSGQQVYQRMRADALVEKLVSASADELPSMTPQLAKYMNFARPKLEDYVQGERINKKAQLHARIALAATDKGTRQSVGVACWKTIPTTWNRYYWHLRVARWQRPHALASLGIDCRICGNTLSCRRGTR
ncbi:MAG: serine/threonine-protein kinase [Pirellulaceae bacterium]